VAAFGWIVLALVFLDELFAVTCAGVWGWHAPGRAILVWLLPIVVMTIWFFFASPKAKFGGPIRRPVVKVVVFVLASLALWDVGHTHLAVAMLVFSTVINALAQIPAIAQLAAPSKTD
jgi:hypothetical protein